MITALYLESGKQRTAANKACLENPRAGVAGLTKSSAHDWSECTKAKVSLTMNPVCAILYT